MLHTPVITPSQRAAIAHRKRMMHPANAVPDLGIDLKSPRKLPPPEIEVRPIFMLLAGMLDLIAAQTAEPVVEEPAGPISAQSIIRFISEHYDIPIADIKSPRRNPDLVRPRWIAMYLARKLTTLSMPQIGRCLGGRDHTTVLNAITKIDRMIKSDAALADEIEGLVRTIKTWAK